MTLKRRNLRKGPVRKIDDDDDFEEEPTKWGQLSLTKQQLATVAESLTVAAGDAYTKFCKNLHRLSQMTPPPKNQSLSDSVDEMKKAFNNLEDSKVYYRDLLEVVNTASKAATARRPHTAPAIAALRGLLDLINNNFVDEFDENAPDNPIQAESEFAIAVAIVKEAEEAAAAAE